MVGRTPPIAPRVEPLGVGTLHLWKWTEVTLLSDHLGQAWVLGMQLIWPKVGGGLGKVSEIARRGRERGSRTGARGERVCAQCDISSIVAGGNPGITRCPSYRRLRRIDGTYEGSYAGKGSLQEKGAYGWRRRQ